MPSAAGDPEGTGELTQAVEALTAILAGLVATRDPGRICALMEDRGIAAATAQGLVACACLLLERLAADPGAPPQAHLEALIAAGVDPELSLAAITAARQVHGTEGQG